MGCMMRATAELSIVTSRLAMAGAGAEQEEVSGASRVYMEGDADPEGMSAQGEDESDAASSPDSSADPSTEKESGLRTATGSKSAAAAAAGEAGSPVSPDINQDNMPGVAAWESAAKVQGDVLDKPFAHSQGIEAPKTESCISRAVPGGAAAQMTVTVKVEPSTPGGLPTIQSAFAEVEVRPGKGSWAAPPNTPLPSKHLQPLSAEGRSQQNMQPDLLPMLEREPLMNSTESAVGGQGLFTRSTLGSAGNEQTIESQQNPHDEAVVAQPLWQQSGAASGEPRGRLTCSSSTSNSSTSSRDCKRSASYSSRSSFRSSAERRCPASHRDAPSESPVQHSQLVANPPHHQLFNGASTQRLDKDAWQTNLQPWAHPRQSVAQEHSIGQGSALTGQPTQSQGWLGVPGPLTAEPAQIAEAVVADRRGPGRGPATTGWGGFRHGAAAVGLGQHGQTMGWAQAPAPPAGLTSAAGLCSSGWGGGAGNPWARTGMTKAQKKAKKKRQGAEMQRAWAQVLVEQGESAAASPPRYD